MLLEILDNVTVEVVRLLMTQLLAGANINDVTPQKASALHLAATHDRAGICTALLGEHIHCDALDDALNNGNGVLLLLTTLVVQLEQLV